MQQTERQWGTPHRSRHPIVFLHGLPGIKSGQNQDLANHIHEQTQRDILIQFGEGLGVRPGTFTFTGEFENKLQLVHQLEKTSDSITLVGHSWGGLQALVLAAHSPRNIRRVILMAPLLGIMARPQIDEILTLQNNNHPEVNFAPRQQLLDDAEAFNARFPVESTAAMIPAQTRITILQPTNDQITPAERAKGLLPLFQTKPEYFELNSDHQFMVNRLVIYRAMTQAIKA